MTHNASNNRRIAKNTLFLYVRMGVSMLVSLYASRVVLRTLGVEDYGIYGVVGGVVSMFGFINSSLAGATSRFFAFELGRGDHEQLIRTFSMAFYAHCLIALVILAICESVGIWFLNHRLVIPPERLMAANWVFQLSVLSMAVSVTQVPYNASIISHEQMNVFAYIEILNVFLRLLIVYLIQVLLFDKLVLYALLVLAVSLLIALLYRVYCVRHYPESHLRKIWDRKLLKQMLSFSGWDLYGHMSTIARTQGVNMLLNLFFGPVVNASSSIATHVQSAVMGFVSNVLTAIKPQIIKYYAQGERNEMVRLISNAVRLNYLILLFISVPLILEMGYVLKLWLGVIPGYCVEMCSLTLVFNFYGNMSSVLIIGIHATGRIIRPSLINGTLYLMVVPITYFAFKSGSNPWLPYLFNVLAVICGMLSNAYTLHLYIREFSLWKFISHDLCRCVFVFCMVTVVCTLMQRVVEEGVSRLIYTVALSTVTLSAMGYWLLIPRSLSSQIVQKVKNRLCKADW